MSATCPDCESAHVKVTKDGFAYCLACAHTWTATESEVAEAFCPVCGGRLL